MNEYYHNKDYYIYGYPNNGLLIVPTEVNDYLNIIPLIANKDIFELRKMPKKDILDYLNKINKFVFEINKLGLYNLKPVGINNLQDAEKNNNSKDFEQFLGTSLEEVKTINTSINKISNVENTIRKMFDIIISNIYDSDFLKWVKNGNNYNLFYSCKNFVEVEQIYQNQKNMVKDAVSNENTSEININLNEVNGMPKTGIVSLPDSSNMPTQKIQSDMTLEDVGLKPVDVSLEGVNDTFKMDSTPSYDNMDTTLHTNEDVNKGGEEKTQGKSLTRKPGYTVGSFKPDENEGLGKAAYTNWYGIILTLIFSFAIGYLIAWILIKVR